jgi:hypothetical protein
MEAEEERRVPPLKRRLRIAYITLLKLHQPFLNTLGGRQWPLIKIRAFLSFLEEGTMNTRGYL